MEQVDLVGFQGRILSLEDITQIGKLQFFALSVINDPCLAKP